MRILRGHAVAALENVALGTNGISHSSVERILPDAASWHTFHAIGNDRLGETFAGLSQNMQRNMNCYGVSLQSAGFTSFSRKGNEVRKLIQLYSLALIKPGTNRKVIFTL